MKKVPNVTATDVAIILGLNPYQTVYELLEQKVENKHQFVGNKFTEHGSRYESVAVEVYENTTGNTVERKQKNSKHPEISYLSGRLDGITNVLLDEVDGSKKRKVDKRCIIEVKCPLKENREELPLTVENMPKYYWVQCQVYMDMFDCDVVDYIEFYIKPNDVKENGKLYHVHVPRDKTWWENEAIPKIKIFYDEMKRYCTLGSLETHPVRQAEKQWLLNIFS